jgi:hypothetical protein
MTNSAWITLFQWCAVVSSVLALASIIGLWVFTDRQAAEKDAEIEELKDVTQALRSFTDVAQLNPTGLPFIEGGSIRYDTPLSVAMRGLYIIGDGVINFKLGKEFEPRYRSIIEKHPRFPFGYFALTEFLRSRDDPDWINYAKQAVAIFEKTTMIEGHDAAHDDALRLLKSYLVDAQKD